MIWILVALNRGDTKIPGELPLRLLACAAPAVVAILKLNGVFSGASWAWVALALLPALALWWLRVGWRLRRQRRCGGPLTLRLKARIAVATSLSMALALTAVAAACRCFNFLLLLIPLAPALLCAAFLEYREKFDRE
jgi:hypothetical protein